MLETKASLKRDVESVLSEMCCSLDRIVKKHIPYAPRDLLLFSPVENDELDVLFKSPVRVPYYIEPSMAGVIRINLYETPVKIVRIRFIARRKIFRDAEATWKSIAKIYLPKPIMPEWGMFLLFSPPVLEYVVRGGAEITSKHVETSEFFKQLIESYLLVLGSNKFKGIDPRQVLNPKTPMKKIKIQYYPKYSGISRVVISYSKWWSSKELFVRIDFKNYGAGNIIYHPPNNIDVVPIYTSEKRILSGLFSLDVDDLIQNVQRGVKEFVKTHACLHIAHKYMEI